MIVLQSPVRFGALSLTSYERERSQNYRPLARPRAIKLSLLSLYGTRHARDFAYQALPLFSVHATLKSWEWAWGRGYCTADLSTFATETRLGLKPQM